MVCSKEIDLNEFDELCTMVAQESRKVVLVLQPVSLEVEGHLDFELTGLLEGLQQEALKKLDHVRIIPRFHRILNLR